MSDLAPNHATASTPPSDRRVLTLLLAAALGTRLFLILVFPNLVVEFPDKVQRYDPVAQSLVRGEGFSRDGQPTATSPPAYPLFLAALYGTFGYSLRAVRIGLAVVDVLGCGMWFLAARRWFGRERAILTTIVLAFSPYLMYPILAGAGDTLFVAAHAILLWLVGRSLDRPSPARFALPGFMVGLAALCRPTALLLPFALLPAILVALRGKRVRRTVLSAAFLAAFVLTLTPWTVRNAVQFRRFIPIQSIGGRLLARASRPLHRQAKVDLTSPAPVPANEAEADQGRYSQVLREALARPLATGQRLLTSMVTMWVSSHSGALAPFLLPANVALLVFAAAGIYATRHRAREQLPLYCVVAYYVVVHSPFVAIFRYLLPTVPILVMLASVPGVAILGWLAHRLRALSRRSVTGEGAA